MEGGPGQKELDGRGDVLTHPHHRQRYPPGPCGEEQQGHGRDRTGHHEQSHDLPALVGGLPGRLPLPGQAAQVGKGDRRHDGALHRQSGQGIHIRPDPLLDQPVQGEGEGQCQRDPRQRALEHHQERDGGARQHDRDPVDGAQPLAQDQRGQGHRHQRVDEVAQGGVGRARAVDAVDVDEPVD